MIEHLSHIWEIACITGSTTMFAAKFKRLFGSFYENKNRKIKGEHSTNQKVRKELKFDRGVALQCLRMDW